MHDGMQYDPIQGGIKVSVADSRSRSVACLVCRSAVLLKDEELALDCLLFAKNI